MSTRHHTTSWESHSQFTRLPLGRQESRPWRFAAPTAKGNSWEMKGNHEESSEIAGKHTEIMGNYRKFTECMGNADLLSLFVIVLVRY